METIVNDILDILKNIIHEQSLHPRSGVAWGIATSAEIGKIEEKLNKLGDE